MGIFFMRTTGSRPLSSLSDALARVGWTRPTATVAVAAMTVGVLVTSPVAAYAQTTSGSDPTLVRDADGMIHPKGHPQGLTLFGGDTTTAAKAAPATATWSPAPLAPVRSRWVGVGRCRARRQQGHRHLPKRRARASTWWCRPRRPGFARRHLKTRPTAGASVTVPFELNGLSARPFTAAPSAPSRHKAGPPRRGRCGRQWGHPRLLP